MIWLRLTSSSGLTNLPICAGSWNRLHPSRAICDRLSVWQGCTLIPLLWLCAYSRSLFAHHIRIASFRLLICCRHSEYLLSAGLIIADFLARWIAPDDGSSTRWTVAWMVWCTITEWPTIHLVVRLHLRTHWLKVVIKLIVQRSFLALLRLPTRTWSHHLIMHLLVKVFSGLLQLSPVVVCLLQMLHPVLELSLFSHKLLNFCQWILPCVVFKHCQSFTQVLVFLGELEDLCISVIQLLRLPLNLFSEGHIALKNFLHHVHGVHNPLSDGVFWLVRCAVRLVRVLRSLVAGDVLQLVSLLLEELVHLFLVFYNSLGDDLPMLYKGAITGLSRRLPPGGRHIARPGSAFSLLSDCWACWVGPSECLTHCLTHTFLIDIWQAA